MACSARPAPFEPAFFYFGPVRASDGSLSAVCFYVLDSASFF